jgi:hypothetical protein
MYGVAKAESEAIRFWALHIVVSNNTTEVNSSELPTPSAELLCKLLFFKKDSSATSDQDNKPHDRDAGAGGRSGKEGGRLELLFSRTSSQTDTSHCAGHPTLSPPSSPFEKASLITITRIFMISLSIPRSELQNSGLSSVEYGWKGLVALLTNIQTTQ